MNSYPSGRGARDMQPASPWIIAALVLVTAAALLAPPMAAGPYHQPFCDIGGSPDWGATIFNFRHLVSFSVLALLAFRVFRHQSIWVPILFMVVVTGVIEVEQAIFGSGHCRLRDMIPNALAIAIGWLASLLVARLNRKSR